MEALMKIAMALLVATLGLATVGCAQVDPKTLALPSQTEPLSLAAPYTYVRESSGLASRWVLTFTVAAGSYTPEREDATGIYYRAKGNALFQRKERYDFGAKEVSKTFAYVHEGGVYVPKDPAQPAKLFIVAGTMREILPSDAEAAAKGPVTIFVPIASANAATAGGLIANGIIAAGMAAEKGNYAFLSMQPEKDSLREVFAVRQ